MNKKENTFKIVIDTSQKRKYNRNRYLGGGIMKKWICAKDVTSLAVIELMHGKKDKGGSENRKW